MNHTMHIQTDKKLFNKRYRYVMSLIAGSLTIYVLIYHFGHIDDALPYVFIATMLWMHLFMHRGHGGHNSGKDK